MTRAIDQPEATGLPPDLLVLEVTDSVLMANVTASLEVPEAIKSLGVGVSIDDFGAGYSSVAYLSEAPLALSEDRPLIRA